MDEIFQYQQKQNPIESQNYFILVNVQQIYMTDDFDIKFLITVEGYKQEAYVPSNASGVPHEASGVTLALGCDLSSQNVKQLRRHKVPQNLIAKLEPFCNSKLKGKAAKDKLKEVGLKLSSDQAKILVDYTMNKYGNRLKSILKRNNMEYSSLSKPVKTVLLSRVIHSWSIKPSIIQSVKENNLQKLAGELGKLQGFGTRGQKESNYITNNKANISNENNSTIINLLTTFKNKLDSGKIPNLSDIINGKPGGVDFSFDISKLRFDGFFIGDELINLHSSSVIDPSLKDLIVPLKIWYDQKITNKNISISIDPHVPTNPNGPLYEKIYYPPQMEGTQFAQTMIEADYIMKQMKIGIDSNNKPFKYPQSLKAVGLSFDNLIQYINNPQERTRQWIVIKDVKFNTVNANRVEIGSITMGLLAKVQKIGAENKLIDSDEQTSLHTQKFCELFTKYYDLIAEEYSPFKTLKRLAKACIIARMMREKMCRIDMKLINSLFEQQKKDKSSKIIAKIQQNLELSPHKTPLINMKQASTIKFNINGGCDLNYKFEGKPLEICKINTVKQIQKQMVPFIFQEIRHCQVQQCQNICRNGYKSLQDTRCSQHTIFVCLLCGYLLQQGEQFLKLSDERMIHKECFQCQTCCGFMAGQYIELDRMFYHKQCIPKNIIGVCHVCQKDVDSNQKYFMNQNGPMHDLCARSFKCLCCGQNIDPVDLKSINSKNYHKNCVKCDFCKKLILQNEFKICGDNVYAHSGCIPTHKCKVCKSSINGSARTMGADFYHAACLVCSKCKKPLQNQIKMDGNGNYYHPNC